MQRKNFIQNTTLFAIGIGIFGKIRWNTDHYEGVDPTTTDILGPFYRPGTPMRSNVIPKGVTGQVLQLSGTIFKEDGKTPYNDCLVEIWQCSPEGIYDNTSDEYRFRGAQKTLSNGKYHFTTTIPVAYLANAEKKRYRPAHIHMRIAGKGGQDLVTQIYIKDDPHIPEDFAARSPQSMKRILEIKKNGKNMNTLQFDIVMGKEFTLDDAAFEKILGLYQMEDKSRAELIRKEDLLLVKLNGQIDEAYYYKGNNAFADAFDTTRLKLELQENGETKLTVQFRQPTEEKWMTVTGKRLLKY